MVSKCIKNLDIAYLKKLFSEIWTLQYIYHPIIQNSQSRSGFQAWVRHINFRDMRTHNSQHALKTIIGSSLEIYFIVNSDYKMPADLFTPSRCAKILNHKIENNRKDISQKKQKVL